MEKLDVYGVAEMSVADQQETDGGLVFLVIAILLATAASAN